MATVMTNDQKIRIALADPDAPWYGSDLVGWVAELLAEKEQMEKVFYGLNCAPDEATYLAAEEGMEVIVKRLLGEA